MKPQRIRVAISGVGLLGPGLVDWRRAAPLLADASAWQSAPTAVPASARLPPTERRRAGIMVKAALVVADEACAAAGVDAAQVVTVFTSSTGDPLNCHLLCEALSSPDRVVSPTRFTNSVHNAPAGYWHIAAQSRRASTSLAAFDASFGAGLLEAAVQCVAGNEPVLLVACDAPYPEPLHSVRPIADVFAVALVLTPVTDASTGPLLSLQPDATEQEPTVCGDLGLEALRASIPAARALPMLCALGSKRSASDLSIEDVPGHALCWQIDLPTP